MGTRFLPATKAVPKELLPIIDQPALQLVIDEAVGAGIDHVVVVSHRSKPAIEAYFQPNAEVLAKLESSGRAEMAERLRAIGRDVRISIAYQDSPRGLGHAVACGREAVGDEPFAVLLPDELMGDSSLLDQMARLCERTGGSVVGLKRVPRDAVSAYGVIDPAGSVDDEGVVAVRGMVEKPPVGEAPSELIIIGRYVLTPHVFDILDRVQPGSGGEIQLTDALKVQAASGPFHGVLSDIRRHDTGNPLGWLTAVVDLALDDPAIAPAFRGWLDQRLQAG
jgi:UTP--glucose-1-phosphate uridylyltransferase